MKQIVITIDGPAGAGKTTVSRILAERLGYRYIDTGALYRGVAVAAKSENIRPDDEAGLQQLCETLDLKLVANSNGLRLLLNCSDISDQIRSPEITMLASGVSAQPVVRNYLLELQRQLGREKGVVFEGRDMGTVVFPQAEVKFYLDADQNIRARRRYCEMQTETHQTLEQIANDIQRRDTNDRTRSVAPMKPPEDAIIIDSTRLSKEQVVDQMLEHIHRVLEL